jgi:hypothetical protein
VGVAEEDFEGRLLSTDFITDSRIQTDLGLRMAIIHVRIDEFALVRKSATESVGDLGQAGVKSAHIIPLWDGITVRVGGTEEDFEGSLGSGILICPANIS